MDQNWIYYSNNMVIRKLMLDLQFSYFALHNILFLAFNNL